MKILMICNDMQVNGISTVILNYVRFLNRDKFQVEIAAGEPINAVYSEELSSKNIKFYRLPNRKKKTLKYRRFLKKIIKENNYDLVHVHGNSATMVLELSIAKKYKVPVRIAHCHNSKCGSILRHKILSMFFKKSYTAAFACSSAAGDWIFGKNNYFVINNGFVVENFKFDCDSRKRYRTELGLTTNYVIGHIGRFNDQKNHLYLIDAFEKIVKNCPTARLLLIGNGPDYEKIKAKISESSAKDNIILYGETNDACGLLSAMDIFAFPSKYEGLGIALLEAQISGLPCVASDVVPKDVVLGDSIKFLPIDEESISLWVEHLSKWQKDEKSRSEFFDLNQEKINNFAIQRNVDKLQNIYIEITN